MKRPVCWGVFLVIVCTTAGCALKDPIGAWQQRVTSYVIRRGNGDANSLRDLADAHPRTALRPAQITLGELSVSASGPTLGANTRDVQGLLLGQREVQGRPWYLFLVGVIACPANSPPQVEDIRLAAMTPGRDTLQWAISRPNAEALQIYRQAAAESVGTGEYASSTLSFFPFILDAYTLTILDDRITVKDGHSTATWQLKLSAEPSEHPPRS